MLYLRLPRLLQDIAIARGDDRYPKFLAALAKTDLLVLDDWGLAQFTPDNLRDLLEILEDRYAARSTVVTSQISTEKGTPCSAIQPSPTPFSTASCTTLTSSN